MIRAVCTLRKGDDDGGQAGALVCKSMDEARERCRPVSNVVGYLKKGVYKLVLQRAFEHWGNIK